MSNSGVGRRKRLKSAAMVLVAAGLLAQLVRIDKANPPVESDVSTSPEVKALLRRACYDCHSNETVWPWYSEIAPISWLLAYDVEEGREHLNFSTWKSYKPKRMRKLLKETAEEIEEQEMPPASYVILHREARLSDGENALLRSWAEDLAERTKAKR
jgi:hypothetical protein